LKLASLIVDSLYLYYGRLIPLIVVQAKA